MAFSILEKSSSPTALHTILGALRSEIGMITTSYGSLGAVNSDLSGNAFSEVAITADNNRYFRNQAGGAWILYFSSSNFSTGNLVVGASTLFTTSIVNPTTAPALTFALTNQTQGTVFGNAASGNPGAPVFTATPTLGVANTTEGSLTFYSATGGSALVRVIGGSGNYNFNLPLSAGGVNQVLTSQGGGSTAMTWTTLSSGGFVTANNGLTANTPTNVQLGGTLLQNTTIETGAFTLTINTAATPLYAMVINSTTSNALNINATSGHCINAVCTTGVPIRGETAGNTAVAQFISTGEAMALYGEINAASTNTDAILMQLVRRTSGTSASGIGGEIEYFIERSSGATSISTALVSRVPTAGSLLTQFAIRCVPTSGVTQDVFSVLGSGATRLNQYGTGAFTGTAAYALQVDASGNIIEGTPAGGNAPEIDAWTPTLTNTTNITSSTAYECFFEKTFDPITGNYAVKCWGKFTVNFTSSSSVAELGISLPEAGFFTQDQELAGGANRVGSVGPGPIIADVTNDRAMFTCTAPNSGTNTTYWFTFNYIIYPQ